MPPRLLDVFDALGPAAESFPRQLGFHELIEIAVEYAAGIGCLHAGSQVLHHLIRLKDVRADLVTPADVGLGGVVGERRSLAPLQLLLVQTRTQHVPGLCAIAMLRAVILAEYHDAGWDMREA